MANWDITTASALNFLTNTISSPNVVKFDTNHFVGVLKDSNIQAAIYTFEVNTSTYAVTTKSNKYMTDLNNGGSSAYFQIQMIDTNHAIYTVNEIINQSAKAQVISIDTSTFAISTSNSMFSFDTVYAGWNNLLKVDTNHFVNFYNGNGTTGRAQVLTINTSTWAITTSSANFQFLSSGISYLSSFSIDANHFITFYSDNNSTYKGYAQTFTINTSTWAVTTAAAVFNFWTSTYDYYNSCFQIDSNHFINFWADALNSVQKAQVMTVNTSTWAVTTAAAALSFSTGTNVTMSGIPTNRCYKIDTNHFIVYWRDGNALAKTQVVEVNTSTWAVTTSAAALTITTGSFDNITVAQMDKNHYFAIYDVATNGYAQIFTVSTPITTNIKTIDGLAYASVKTVDGLAIASVKTFNGLA